MIGNTNEAVEVIKDYFSDDQEMEKTLNTDKMDDVLSELADNSIDVYNNDLIEWAAIGDNYKYIEDAINNLGWEGVGGELMSAYKAGQYYACEELLRDALDELRGPTCEQCGNSLNNDGIALLTETQVCKRCVKRNHESVTA